MSRFLNFFTDRGGDQKPTTPSKTADYWPLNLPLIRFSEKRPDTWTLADACQGVLIMGELGSGKTSGSGQLLARQYLKAGFGGLVLCHKHDPQNPREDEATLWRNYLTETGRIDDGLFFSADADLRFNFLDYESKTSGLDFVENLVSLLTDIASVKKRNQTSSNEQEYWLPQKEKLLRNAISLLLLAKEPITMRNLYEIIITAPNNLEQTRSEEWHKSSYLFRLFTRASHTQSHHPEWFFIEKYWMHERPMMDPDTRSNVDTDYTGMFDPLTRGKIGELFSTTTNITPEDILNGKVVVIDIPYSKYRAVGQFAALIWSQLLQRTVDRRSFDPPSSRPVFLWADEAHHFCVDQDAAFQTTARSKGISTVRLTQNLPNFLDAYGPNGKHKVDTLLGNHSTKIFHRNSCVITNEWASKVIGKDTQYRHSISNTGSIHQPVGNQTQTSVQEVEEEVCQPKEFMGLKNGAARNDYIVEGILFQSGRLWKGDQRWTVRKFKQRQSR
jgi:TraM recognition site of TraD and TraG